MSATENKQLMERSTPALPTRCTLFIQSLADDVSWCVTGQNKWSHTSREAGGAQTAGYFSVAAGTRSRTVRNRFIADGDFVVVEAAGDNLTKTGVRYDNEYCMVFRWSNRQDRRDQEYCDSALVERALGNFRHPDTGSRLGLFAIDPANAAAERRSSWWRPENKN